jgi:hypothetical protein
LSRTQSTSQVAPFASIRSSQTEPEPKRKSYTDDFPVTPSPRPQFPQIHSLPPRSFLDPEFMKQQGRRVGEFLGGVPPATEEIVAAVELGLRKRSWLPSGWAMEEVAAAATCLSRRPAPDLNPHRRRSTRAGWGSLSSSSPPPWPVPGRTSPAMEEIVAAVGLGLRKRSWPPSGWGYRRGHGCRNLPLMSPRSRSKPSPPLKHTREMGELLLLLAHDPVDAPTKLLPLHIIGDPARVKKARSAP